MWSFVTTQSRDLHTSEEPNLNSWKPALTAGHVTICFWYFTKITPKDHLPKEGTMQRWSLFLTMLSLAACAQRSGGGSSAPAPGVQSDPCASVSAKSLSPSDPYESLGKLILDNREAQTLSVAELAAGTEFTVTLKTSCIPGEISAQASRSSLGRRAFTWRLPIAMTQTQLGQIADADDCVYGISEKIEVGITTTDPLSSQQQHLTAIEKSSIGQLINVFGIRKPVVIAVIDTGIDMKHEDLKNVLWTNAKEIPSNKIDDDRNGYVDDVNGYNFAQDIPSPNYVDNWSGYHHGTHVSGLAAAQGENGIGVSGVMAGGARIMMLNVFGDNSSASSTNAVNAIHYAADNGADVINMSIGGNGKSAAYESAISYAIKKGVTVVAAAGNDRSEIGQNYFFSPGGYGQEFAGMLTVGSLDSANSNLSVYSNFSPTYVEIGAPGTEDSTRGYGLLSTYPGNRYQRIQGTSMASPVVAGAAAVTIAALRERGYAPSPATVEGVVEESAKRLENLRGKIRDGRALNMKLLVEFIENTYPRRKGTPTDPGVPASKACSSTSSSL
jgi:subtilisin family serine protease